ncbi:WecB/TagA/CpsF family glycosyltransferase [Colwellia sp. E2M01]|uniref:WecB/TagA/CpsF family glycosyltransferase n=1 Tax=Colwellia sp. E2M01 TaxID=2841561 RepID=UPI001C0A25BA|nr:WecB/TagA/CpsF family glycosyltransferase [Colwellia sp. E2M01]MBU2869368.1 WecB/TagA/CpsF family glycosyltransferase [Colwellia sp. E2M01]
MFSKKIDLFNTLNNVKKTNLITFVNPISFHSFLNYVNRKDFDLIYSDGLLLTRLHNIFFREDKIERLSFDFSSLAGEVLSHAQKEQKTIAFVGGSEQEALIFKEKLTIKYPELKFHCYSGFFTDENSINAIFKELNKIAPNIVICGMGYPRQEDFLVQCKKMLVTPFIGFTCGGFITQTSIKADYYFPIVKHLGLRWLQRAIMHQHVRKRLLKDYPIFLYKYIIQACKSRKELYKS